MENIWHSSPLEIWAGHCSENKNNIEETERIARQTIRNPRTGRQQRIVNRTRGVAFKSRTGLKDLLSYMGMDWKAIQANDTMYMEGKGHLDYLLYPSLIHLSNISRATGVGVASEILMPHLQLPVWGRYFKGKSFQPWTAAVDSKGTSAMEFANWANRFGWDIALKNPKISGKRTYTELLTAPQKEIEKTTVFSTWQGAWSWAGSNQNTTMIHRGVDMPSDLEGMDTFRNLPIHRVAAALQAVTGCNLGYDPSHINGQGRKEHIVEDAIEAAQTINPFTGNPQYQVLLLEVGNSTTDTEQHITLNQLQQIGETVIQWRPLVAHDFSNEVLPIPEYEIERLMNAVPDYAYLLNERSLAA
jgi:hypothetical protein